MVQRFLAGRLLTHRETPKRASSGRVQADDPGRSMNCCADELVKRLWVKFLLEPAGELRAGQHQGTIAAGGSANFVAA